MTNHQQQMTLHTLIIRNTASGLNTARLKLIRMWKTKDLVKRLKAHPRAFAIRLLKEVDRLEQEMDTLLRETLDIRDLRD